MPCQTIDVPLLATAPGLIRSVRMVRYGKPDARPKAYIHAALHADEVPGLLVVRHLLDRLDEADDRGEIRGQIVVVPYANPIGLAQFVNGEHLGRYDLASGANFNRNWPDLTSTVADRVGSSLTDDARTNVDTIRRAMRDLLDEQVPHRELESLFLALSREAFDADLALDLHCDDEGLMHLFAHPKLWPGLSDLAGELPCRAVFLEGDTGGSTFSEVCAAPWLRLAARFPDKPIPAACAAATVELRGFIDVSDELAAADAAALVRVLRRRGYLAGGADEAPAPSCEATGFDACDIVRAPTFGVLLYRVELGETVRRGQPIADIVDPSGRWPNEARSTVRAGTDGVVLTRRLKKLVAPNQTVAKIAGREPLAHRQGYLLED